MALFVFDSGVRKNHFYLLPWASKNGRSFTSSQIQNNIMTFMVKSHLFLLRRNKVNYFAHNCLFGTYATSLAKKSIIKEFCHIIKSI